MNKAQKRQLALIEVYLANGMADTAARSLSALIRSAMTSKSRAELMALAVSLQLTQQADFII
jgi:hypothetical protein